MTLSVDSMDKNIVDILRRHPRGDGKPRRNTAGAIRIPIPGPFFSIWWVDYPAHDCGMLPYLWHAIALVSQFILATFGFFSGLIIELPYGSDALNVNTLAGRASWIGHELTSPEFAWQISRNKDFSHIEGSPNKARLNSGKITSFEIKRSNQNRWDCKM